MVKKGLFSLDREKIESHYFLLNVQIFFHGSPDFSLSVVDRSKSGTQQNRKNNNNINSN